MRATPTRLPVPRFRAAFAANVNHAGFSSSDSSPLGAASSSGSSSGSGAVAPAGESSNTAAQPGHVSASESTSILHTGHCLFDFAFAFFAIGFSSLIYGAPPSVRPPVALVNVPKFEFRYTMMRGDTWGYSVDNLGNESGWKNAGGAWPTPAGQGGLTMLGPDPR